MSRDIGYLSSPIPCGRTPSNEGDFVKFTLENPYSPLLEGDIEPGGSLCADNLGKKVKTETMCSHNAPPKKKGKRERLRRPGKRLHVGYTGGTPRNIWWGVWLGSPAPDRIQPKIQCNPVNTTTFGPLRL